MLVVFVGCVVLKILDLFSGTLAKTSVYSLRRGLMLLEFSGCVFLKIFNLFSDTLLKNAVLALGRDLIRERGWIQYVKTLEGEIKK